MTSFRDILAHVPALTLRVRSLAPPSFEALVSSSAVQDLVHFLAQDQVSVLPRLFTSPQLPHVLHTCSI